MPCHASAMISSFDQNPAVINGKPASDSPPIAMVIAVRGMRCSRPPMRWMSLGGAT